jgi:serine/threonine protein phosphatase PrpC
MSPGCDRSFRSMTRSFGISHVGRVRKNNEDRYLAISKLGLYVVADGMGGAQAGERASQLTIDTLGDEISKKGSSATLTDLREAVEEANRRVHAEARAHPQYSGMGTTVVAVLVRPAKAYVVNVGDSRLYKKSVDSFECITSDHSWVNEVGRSIGLSEDELKTHAYRNMLTCAIGADDNVEPQKLEIDFTPGELLLLSSDGLHGVIDDAQVSAVLGQPTSLQERGEALVESVLDQGAPDNVTAVLIANYDD